MLIITLSLSKTICRLNTPYDARASFSCIVNENVIGASKMQNNLWCLVQLLFFNIAIAILNLSHLLPIVITHDLFDSFLCIYLYLLTIAVS